jgi:hypothetical protein
MRANRLLISTYAIRPYFLFYMPWLSKREWLDCCPLHPANCCLGTTFAADNAIAAAMASQPATSNALLKWSHSTDCFQLVPAVKLDAAWH